MIMLPACVVVLAHGSEIDWNLPPASLIVSIVLRRSRVDLATLSSFQTINDVAGSNLVKHALKLRPLPIEPGNLLTENLLTSSYFERF